MSRVSDIKLKRTDTTHDLSQKAEKRYSLSPVSLKHCLKLSINRHSKYVAYHCDNRSTNPYLYRSQYFTDTLFSSRLPIKITKFQFHTGHITAENRKSIGTTSLTHSHWSKLRASSILDISIKISSTIFVPVFGDIFCSDMLERPRRSKREILQTKLLQID